MLALAEMQETWDAYEPESDDGYRRWDDEDDEDDAQSDDSSYQLNELVDSSIRLTRWTDPAGASARDISLVVADAEVCAATPSSDLRPYTSDYEGYMGNYGNTLDRWYRRAAVVVWPRDRGFTNQAEASPFWAMDELSARARDRDPTLVRTAAATLAPFWDSVVRSQERPEQLLAKTLAVAVAGHDAAAASMLLRPFTMGERAKPPHGHADAIARGITCGIVRAWR